MKTPTTSQSPAAVDSLCAQLRSHALYTSIATAEQLRVFTEHHVVCVLDFMSLLKSLQRELTCTEVPWAPRANARLGRFVHEIVLGEEFDLRADGRVQSHFEWYLEAMDELGADSAPARALADELRSGVSLATAVERSGLPPAARAFGLATARALELPLAARAAIFFHGREELIPALFMPLVLNLQRAGLACKGLCEYLERHIENDGGEHGELAGLLLGEVGAGLGELEAPVVDALQARVDLWDALVLELGSTAHEARGRGAAQTEAAR